MLYKKGFIRILPDHSVSEIMENLDEEQKGLIISARRRISRSDGQPSNIIDLVFGTTYVPRYIFALSVRIFIPPSIPIPKRCFICQHFGHVKDQCRTSSPNCKHCAGKHSTNDCNDPRSSSKCFNCARNHESSSRDFPVYKFEFDVMKERYLYNISESEARNNLYSKDGSIQEYLIPQYILRIRAQTISRNCILFGVNKRMTNEVWKIWTQHLEQIWVFGG